MKRFLFGFIVGLLMFNQSAGVQAQQEVADRFHISADAIAAVPKVEITLARAIEILSDFHLIQESTTLMDHIGYFGLTNLKTAQSISTIAPISQPSKRR